MQEFLIRKFKFEMDAVCNFIGLSVEFTDNFIWIYAADLFIHEYLFIKCE